MPKQQRCVPSNATSTVLSSPDASLRTHHVSVAELSLSDVSLEWITVPKVGESAPPLAANVFLNGDFLSKSKIPHVSPQESCSLGVGVEESSGAVTDGSGDGHPCLSSLGVHPRTGSAVRPSNTAGSKLRRPLPQLTGSENPHQDHDALQSTPRPEAVRLPREQRPQTLMDDTPS